MDTVDVSGSTIRGINERGINTSSNIDEVIIRDSIIIGDPEAVRLGSNNDRITLGTGADIRGIINCGDEGGGSLLDTIIFAMDVPEEQLIFVSSQIAAATVPDGNITINGLTYEWINCNLLVNELNGTQFIRPIPTLSEWGLIATAGALGVFGMFYMMRRRQIA